MLPRPASDFDPRALAAALVPEGFGRVEVLERTASTNAWLAERPADRDPTGRPGDALDAVVAGFQSAGRGRLDRQWQTPPGEALTFSVGCTPRTPDGRAWPVAYLPWLTLLLGHAVVRAVRELAGVPAVLKWPNDVLVADRKLCGVLATVVPRPAGEAPGVVVGAGVNVHQSALPVPTATSLRRELGDAAVPGRQELLVRVLREFARCYRDASRDPAAQLGPDGPLRAVLEAELDTLGRDVRLHLPGRGEPQRARAVGLGVSGELVVRDAAGDVRELSSGDVVHLRAADDGTAPSTAVRRAHAECTGESAAGSAAGTGRAAAPEEPAHTTRAAASGAGPEPSREAPEASGGGAS